MSDDETTFDEPVEQDPTGRYSRVSNACNSCSSFEMLSASWKCYMHRAQPLLQVAQNSILAVV